MTWKVANKPPEISFDDDFIYLEKETEPINLRHIQSVTGNKISYIVNGIDLKIKLPHYYFIDKNWIALNDLIQKKNVATTNYETHLPHLFFTRI